MERDFQDDNLMKTFLRIMPLVLALTACGGGGDNSNTSPTSLNTTPPTVNVPTCLTSAVSTASNVLQDGICISVKPTVACLTPKVLQNGVCVSVANICQTETEKTWVRAYLDDEYLWYNEIKDVPKENYQTPQAYFSDLLVKSKDKFSYTASEAEIDAYYQSGADISYGAMWVSDGNYRRVAFVEPDSVAEQQGLKRGDYLWRVDGLYLWELSDELYFNALYPSYKGISHYFEIYDARSGETKQVQLVSEDVIKKPVPFSTILMNNNKKVGYLLFNEHIATASSQLMTAVKQFQTANIDDLVLDLRYNSGGFVYVADELASMLAGKAAFNQIFTALQYNDKHPERSYAYFFEKTAYEDNSLLPFLALKRVFVLTSNMTCSASEAIINGLSPFVEVVRVGSTTCGKPYGFSQENNCGTAYFAINFQGINSIGQSVPVAGYAPTCAANDDLNNPLGNPMESMLSTALYYQQHGACPITSLTQSAKLVQPRIVKEVYRVPWRKNMITNHPSNK